MFEVWGKMKCWFCGSEDSRVIDSRSSEDNMAIRRRRECLGCGRRFTTYETMEETPILVVKSNGTRQSFDSQKIKRGIIKACEKRPVTMETIDKMTANVTKSVFSMADREISSKVIGELVMDEIKKVDEVAYVRYASVYRKFEDITSFMEELQKLMDNRG